MKNLNQRPLGDAADRSYATKLDRFARFAEPELHRAIDELGIRAGDRVVDAGCGVGLVTRWLGERVGGSGTVIGLDLSMPHLRLAVNAPGAGFVQGDLARLCLGDASVDLIWCCNTVNHLARPVDALTRLRATLRPAGTLALAQSAFLPEMYFAWDARLEDAVRQACYAYYREKYGLSAAETAGTRRLVGMMLEAGFASVSTRTYVVERMQPLSGRDRDYFIDAVFNGYWGPKLKPYLTADDWLALESLCDPASSAFCLDRADFHHIQTLTVVQGIAHAAAHRSATMPDATA